jgi:tetratricopeptide (TPR) repeat protein
MNRSILLSVSLLVFLGLNACEKKTDPALSFDDERNPHIKAATESVSNGLFEQAVEDYEKALAANPKLARANYELALLHSDHLANYASAIHYLTKYAQLTKGSPDAAEVEALIEKNKVDLALTIPNSPVQNAEIMAKISAENVELKKSLTAAMQTIAQKDAEISGGAVTAMPASTPPMQASAPTTHAQPSAPSAYSNTAAPTSIETSAPARMEVPSAPAAPATPAASGEMKVYTIRSGDSLWKIAAEFFPGEVTDGIKKIKDANPDITKNERNLKPGRTLNIPL